jgi:hypothetical protein
MRSLSCLCICPPYQLLNQLADFYEIQYGDNSIEGDLDTLMFNGFATFPKLRTFKLLTCGRKTSASQRRAITFIVC